MIVSDNTSCDPAVQQVTRARRVRVQEGGGWTDPGAAPPPHSLMHSYQAQPPTSESNASAEHAAAARCHRDRAEWSCSHNIISIISAVDNSSSSSGCYLVTESYGPGSRDTVA